MDSLSDPETLRDREGVEFVEETQASDDPGAFEAVRERFETSDGVAVVGVTRDDGALLLVDREDGWLPPGSHVEPGADWVATGRRAVEEQAGVPVSIEDVERALRIDYRLETDGERPDDEVTAHVVFLRASPAVDEADALDPGVADDDAPAVEWFHAVPDDVDPGHGDDVRLFLD